MGEPTSGAQAIVIGNCQAAPLARALSLFCADLEFDHWFVHVADDETRAAAFAERIDHARRSYRLIVHVDLSPQFLGLATDAIGTTFAGLPRVKISKIFFNGLHPDAAIMGGLGARVRGPTGNYHSKIVLQAFLRGLSVRDTVDLFTPSVFDAARFPAEYDASLATMRHRDRTVDVPVSPLLPGLLASGLLPFYTMNHPTALVIAAYAHAIAEWLQAQGHCCRSDVPPDPALCPGRPLDGVSLPIYPYIAACHGVAALGSYEFRTSGDEPAVLGLDAFVAQELAVLHALGRTAVAARIPGPDTARFAFLDQR